MKKIIKAPCFIGTRVKPALAFGHSLTASKKTPKRSPYIAIPAPQRQRFSSPEQENLHSVPRSAWLKLLDPHPSPSSKLGQWVESGGAL